jgi:hypothetical protein
VFPELGTTLNDVIAAFDGINAKSETLETVIAGVTLKAVGQAKANKVSAELFTVPATR